MSSLTVMDIFCGAGGFSEGFRQQGFEIVHGVDKWQPAIDTFNHNFGLSCDTRDVLEFLESVDAIEQLPDTDIILGSPPCVSFSSSNISGKADKSQGVKLTQIFLRIVAVKKWKRNSTLKAWFMENVPQSAKHLAKSYTFKDLGLDEWAIKNRKGPSKIAITLEPNRVEINSADYGSVQTRTRVISGEIIPRKDSFIFNVPETTHCKTSAFGKNIWRTLVGSIARLPAPSSPKDQLPSKVKDPNYPGLSLKSDALTDHFYDTGLYYCEWKLSRYLKTNHPYMGKMSFPEDFSKPSRTVTATKIGSSREALIYKSEYKRIGDGEFRTPTVREAACIMGFPITYQFKGSEGTKWRLVGNAVCPSVGRAFAQMTRKELSMKPLEKLFVQDKSKLAGVENLNTFSEKSFDSPPQKNKNSRFRRHPFKDGNMTVTLSNYDIEKKGKADPSKWLVTVQYGSGDGFPTFKYDPDIYKQIETIIRTFDDGKEIIKTIKTEIIEKTSSALEMQRLYELQSAANGFLDPTELVERLGRIIDRMKLKQPLFQQNGTVFFERKKSVPTKQLFALYGLCRIASKANSEHDKRLKAKSVSQN